ncbi:MAG: cytidylate kinase-like family protein [Anaerotruncus sp.]|nr:cytidylate kinase-like family protein [Anaerotruncus sp.]
MKLITVGREFGSGGRELGKRLADTLGFAYYDRELISAVAEKSELDEQYVAGLLE